MRYPSRIARSRRSALLWLALVLTALATAAGPGSRTAAAQPTPAIDESSGGGDDTAAGDEDVAAGANEAMLETEARQRFELASTMFEQGRLEEASAEFLHAYELSGRPELLYNLYLCARDTGDARSAADYLRRFLNDASEVPSRGLLEERLRHLDTQLELDAARAEREAMLESQRAAAEEAAQEAAAAAEAERQSSESRQARLGPILTLSVGIATVAAGLGVGLSAMLLHADLEERCTDGRCTSDAQDDLDALRTRDLVADVVTGVGGALTLAGILWWALLPDAEAADDAGSGPHAHLRVGPLGVALEGSF